MTLGGVNVKDAAKRFWYSTGERVVRTFAQVFVAQMLIGGLNFESGTPGTASQLLQAFSGAEKALVSGTAAAIALLMSLAGKAVGNTNTPSLLPETYDPATPPTGE